MAAWLPSEVAFSVRHRHPCNSDGVVAGVSLSRCVPPTLFVSGSDLSVFLKRTRHGHNAALARRVGPRGGLAAQRILVGPAVLLYCQPTLLHSVAQRMDISAYAA